MELEAPRLKELKKALALSMSIIAPRFDSSEFPELPHRGSCGPEAGCDADCMTAASMSEHNRIIDYCTKVLCEAYDE